MRIMQAISAVFGFRNGPTTFLVVLIYAAIFAVVLVTDDLPSVPRNQKGLDLEEAYADLQQITRNPHPYNSHENDLVHTYIYNRLQNITSSSPHAHLVSDTTSNFSVTTGSYGISYGTYFEGTNILVKIDGTDSSEPGVLFSAHYDSVSTGPGATDDATGIVTMIQMVRLLVQEGGRPRRTAVFNFNNGEEDGLNGARAFLQHPWSNLTDVFINMEGAASGGRPILFRSSSLLPVLSFKNPHVPHPHGNVLSSDAFALNIIRSRTDFSIYTEEERNGKPPMQGLDFAFYKKRAFYHTKYDAIPHTLGGKKALWAMMESVRGAGDALLNGDWEGGVEEGGLPVYFDLFGRFFFVLPVSTLLVSNIVLLVVGPLLLLLIYMVDMIIQYKRRERVSVQAQAHLGPRRRQSTLGHLWTRFSSFRWLGGLWWWLKFWLALVVTIGFQVLLVFGYSQVNPHVIYSHPYTYLFTSLSLAYLTLTLTLSIPLPFTHTLLLPERQKNITLAQLYILTWILLLLSTISGPLGGTYFVTAWNAVVWVGSLVGVFEGMVGARGSEGDVRADVEDEYASGAHTVRFETPSEVEAREHHESEAHVIHDDDRTREEDAREDEEREDEEDSTERTPLIRGPKPKKPILKKDDTDGSDSGAIGWWIVQLLLIVPLPVTLLAHLLVILVGSMPQTLADGSSAILVYAALSAMGVLVVLPVTPFAFKMGGKGVLGAVGVVFGVGTVWMMLGASSFGEGAPLKVFFQQSVEISSRHNDTSVNGTTMLSGLAPYMQRDIIPALPSTVGKEVRCVDSEDTKRRGLVDCFWDSSEGGLVPSPSGSDSEEGRGRWFEGKVEHDVPGEDDNEGRMSRFEIRAGEGTRGCRIYFDDEETGRAVRAWRVRGGDQGWVSAGGRKDTSEEGEERMGEIRLWKRTWDGGSDDGEGDRGGWVVDVKWDEERLQNAKKQSKRGGRIACGYAEYESGSIGQLEGRNVAMGEQRRLGRIPAFEEVLRFLPGWVVVSKANDGLVEVWEGWGW